MTGPGNRVGLRGPGGAASPVGSVFPRPPHPWPSGIALLQSVARGYTRQDEDVNFRQKRKSQYMSWMRIACVPLGIASLWLLAGALGQQPGPAPSRSAPTPRPAPPPPPKADAAATKLLSTAAAALDPDKLAWVETTLWQQANLQGLTFRAEGLYLAAPGNRLRLDLQVHLGDTQGKLLVVSDGVTWWERLQVGNGEQADIKKMDLKTVLATLNSPNMPPAVKTEFFQRFSFTGLAPLLNRILAQMTVTGAERLTWKGRQVNKLTAVWSGEAVKNLVGGPNARWPEFLP